MYSFASKVFSSALILFVFNLSASAQFINDECYTAIHIQNSENYCSTVGRYSNENASTSDELAPECWFGNTLSNDVWFSFAPTKPGAYVQLKGETSEGVGSLVNPSLAIYEGTCRNLVELACGSVASGENIVELTITDLVIGQLYFIRIDARNDNIGTFQLCIDVFNPVQSPEGDCGNAVILCDKSPFQIENLQGTGSVDDNLLLTCLENELASVWYKWTCKESGTLTMILTPNNPNSNEEDLDFAIFELPVGLDDCNNRTLIRCMASGESGGCLPDAWAVCTGPTGLSSGSQDDLEERGCYTSDPCTAFAGPGNPPEFDDNFLAPINMVAGQSYALVVNNYSQSGFGFSIEFGGTGTFQGPEPDFDIEAIQAFECDKTILFDDLSVSNTDQIVAWNWNFGAGANPTRGQGDMTHEVVYESFGPKLVALTVETSRGCQVTKILDFYVEPCCQDTSTLDIRANGINLVCSGVPNGRIEAEGISGSPEYSFSLNGEEFQPSPVFIDLDVGNYIVYIQDEKGCNDTTVISLDEPEPLIVDAGPDLFVELGESTQINSAYTPIDSRVDVEWTPPDGLSCLDCLDPFVVSPGTTTYTITIEDEAGCRTTDEVTIFVELNRPIFAPNIISPQGGDLNSYFKLFSGPGGEIIEELYVYDRWGNLVYEGTNLPLDREELLGWDGTFQGELVNPGVFAWQAKVRFIDQVVIDYSGTVTVVR